MLKVEQITDSRDGRLAERKHGRKHYVGADFGCGLDNAAPIGGTCDHSVTTCDIECGSSQSGWTACIRGPATTSLPKPPLTQSRVDSPPDKRGLRARKADVEIPDYARVQDRRCQHPSKVDAAVPVDKPV